MTLLKDFCKHYGDTWLLGFTDKHTERSYIRIIDWMEEKSGTIKIRVFAYYAKTNRVGIYSFIKFAQMASMKLAKDIDKETELELNALYTKELLKL